MGRGAGGCSTICRGCSWASTMRGAGGRDRGASQLYARRCLVLQAVAIGALMLLDVAWGQVMETLPEVTVSAPRRAPVRRAAPTARPAPSTPSTRVSAPAPSRLSAPAPAPQIPAFQAVATTPVTGLGVDRDKIPAMVLTIRHRPQNKHALATVDWRVALHLRSRPRTSRASIRPT